MEANEPTQQALSARIDVLESCIATFLGAISQLATHIHAFSDKNEGYLEQIEALGHEHKDLRLDTLSVRLRFEVLRLLAEVGQ